MSPFTPVNASLESMPASSRVRQIYPEDSFPNGQYVRFPMGRVRYWILGPEKGIKVVLIHGMSVPSLRWLEIAPYLASENFRVLVYDLYGRGYSESPQTTYNTPLFVTQLAFLMQYIQWRRAHIVGFAIGGGIAAAFGAAFPHLVAGKLVLITATGIEDRPPTLVDDGSEVTFQPSLLPMFAELHELQKRCLPGYEPGIISCIRFGPLWNLGAAYDELRRQSASIAVLLLHGALDQVVHCTESRKIRERVPHAKLVVFEDGDHDLLVLDGRWQAVARALVEFLS